MARGRKHPRRHARDAARARVRPGISTAELDTIAEDFIRSHDGAIPAFKGLYGFPGSICASVNQRDRARHSVEEARAEGRRHHLARRRRAATRATSRDSAATVPVGDGRRADAQKLLDVTRAVARGGDRRGAARATTSATSARRCRRSSRRRASASCAISSATASASSSTRSRRCRTTASRSAARSSCPGSRSRSSRW